MDVPALVATAAAAFDAVTEEFLAGVGAPSAVVKGGRDFATEVDLALERRLTARLEAETGIAVHGEEFGGPPVGEGWVWVLDPIDGTFNFSAGLPISGLLLGLLHDGLPQAGLTWLPQLGLRYHAVVGGPVFDGDRPLPPLAPVSLVDVVVTFGTFDADSRGRFPGRFRVALLEELSRSAGRFRILGSTGAEMAFTAAGLTGGSVVFGRNAWDNAAGAALVLAAGGVVTDLAGRPWTVDSDSMLAGAPGVHDELLAIVARVREEQAS